jgi:hypothetical protein
VSPFIRRKPTSEGNTEGITALLRHILARGSITVARRVRQFLHAAFAYGLKTKTNLHIDISGIDYGFAFNPVTGTQTVRMKNKAWDHYSTRVELAIAANGVAGHT